MLTTKIFWAMLYTDKHAHTHIYVFTYCNVKLKFLCNAHHSFQLFRVFVHSISFPLSVGGGNLSWTFACMMKYSSVLQAYKEKKTRQSLAEYWYFEINFKLRLNSVHTLVVNYYFFYCQILLLINYCVLYLLFYKFIFSLYIFLHYAFFNT